MHISDRLFALLLKRNDNHAEMCRLMSEAADGDRVLTSDEGERFDALTRDVQEADLLIAYLVTLRLALAKERVHSEQSSKRTDAKSAEAPVQSSAYPSWTSADPSHQRVDKKSRRVPIFPKPTPMSLCDCTLAGGDVHCDRSYLVPVPFSEMDPPISY